MLQDGKAAHPCGEVQLLGGVHALDEKPSLHTLAINRRLRIQCQLLDPQNAHSSL